MRRTNKILPSTFVTTISISFPFSYYHPFLALQLVKTASKHEGTLPLYRAIPIDAEKGVFTHHSMWGIIYRSRPLNHFSAHAHLMLGGILVPPSAAVEIQNMEHCGPTAKATP